MKMTTSSNSTFGDKGNEVAVEAGRLAALTDELTSENGSCSDEPQVVGSWITAIGKAVLAVFGIGVAGQK
jgi:hypothetical protein